MSEPPFAIARSTAGPSLNGEPWLADPRLQHLMRAIAGSDEEIRIVGGAVRNALLGRDVADVDLATTATPPIIMKRARQNGMRPIPTGIDHGTVTILVDGKLFEVTTLREDISTDGRHATVKFGRDWTADARRRDFTVNALYVTADGAIIDLVGGLADCETRRIRFIGDADARIREDYLRILRLFRFHASVGQGPIDADGLAAAMRHKTGIAQLSGERIAQEMLKLIGAERAPDVVGIMWQSGILDLALGTDVADITQFTRLHATLAALSATTDPALPAHPAVLLLASLVANERARVEALAQRLRLSNAIRDRMMTASTVAAFLDPGMTDHAARAAIFANGNEALIDAVFLAAARNQLPWPRDRIVELLRLAQRFIPPKVPVSGRDLLVLGVEPGRTLGEKLKSLKEAWIASDFTLTRQQLLDRLVDNA